MASNRRQPKVTPLFFLVSFLSLFASFLSFFIFVVAFSFFLFPWTLVGSIGNMSSGCTPWHRGLYSQMCMGECTSYEKLQCSQVASSMAPKVCTNRLGNYKLICLPKYDKFPSTCQLIEINCRRIWSERCLLELSYLGLHSYPFVISLWRNQGKGLSGCRIKDGETSAPEYCTVLSFERSPIIFIYDANPPEALCLLFVFVFACECCYTPVQAITWLRCHSWVRHLLTPAGEQPGSSCPPASGPLSSSLPTDQVHWGLLLPAQALVIRLTHLDHSPGLWPQEQVWVLFPPQPLKWKQRECVCVCGGVLFYSCSSDIQQSPVTWGCKIYS